MEIKEMMDTWTLQKGIPLVLVKCEGNTLRLQQERFLKGVFEEDPEWANLQSRYPHLSYYDNTTYVLFVLLL